MSNENRVPGVRISQPDPGREQRLSTFKASQWISLLFWTLEVFIALRIGLKFMGANPDSPIVTLIYGVTSLFLVPFAGLIASITSGKLIFEVSSLYAIGIYALIAIAFERLIWLIFYRPRGSTEKLS